MLSKETDKLPGLLEFINTQLLLRDTNRPLIIGLAGFQGSGKSTLVSSLITARPDGSTAVFSIDDCYLTYAEQQELARQNPQNKMLQHRGVPSTHDIDLCLQTITQLTTSGGDDLVKLPKYDKSAYDGNGDRMDISEWTSVDKSKIDLIVLEGWCVGFQAVTNQELEHQYNLDSNDNNKFMKLHSLDDIKTINEKLKSYHQIWSTFDAFVLLDVDNDNGAQIVYKWRMQQEHELRKRTNGRGMTDDAVKEFVNGYMPCYELYWNGLRSRALWRDKMEKMKNRMLRFIMGDNREIIRIEIL
ncbi:P-loop containing nucleoside triphosphate hydrolase protein [Dipodascopsis uninucleata]